MEVMPRLVWPSWRWMTISGTPSRAISPAWAWRSWCGAKRRRTPASRATAAQLRTGGAGCPRPSACRTVDDAEQRSDRQLDPHGQPGRELLPGPVVHPHLAAPAKVGLGERERLADAQASAPEHDDQAAQPAAVDGVAGVAHHGDDLLDRGRVGGVTHPLLVRRAPGGGL